MNPQCPDQNCTNGIICNLNEFGNSSPTRCPNPVHTTPAAEVVEHYFSNSKIRHTLSTRCAGCPPTPSAGEAGKDIDPDIRKLVDDNFGDLIWKSSPQLPAPELEVVLEAVRKGGWYDANPRERQQDYLDTDVAAERITQLYNQRFEAFWQALPPHKNELDAAEAYAIYSRWYAPTPNQEKK